MCKLAKKIYDATNIKVNMDDVYDYIYDWLDMRGDENIYCYDVYYTAYDGGKNDCELIFNVCINEFNYAIDDTLIGFDYDIKDVEIIF